MKLVLLAVLLAGAARAADVPVASISLSTHDTLVSISSAPRVAVPLELFVRASVDRNLSYLSSLEGLDAARQAAKAQRTGFDPTFNASYAQSQTVSRVVTTPGLLPNPYTQKSQTFSAGVSKNTSLGTTLSATAQTVRTEQTLIAPVQPLHQSGVSLTLTQPLLEGGGRASAYAAARIAELGGEAALALARRTLEQAVAQTEAAYWALRQAELDEDAAAKSLGIALETLKRDKQLNYLKLLSDHDVLTAREQVEILGATYLGAQRQRQNAADDLVFLAYGEETRARLEQEGFVVATDTATASPEPEVPPLAEAVARALESRADVRSARKTLAQAEAREASTRNALLPKLDVTGTMARGGTNQTGLPGSLRDSIDGFSQNRDKQWSVGANFSMPIGNRPDRARYESAKASAEQARLAVVAAENTVRSEVRAAIRALRIESLRYAVAKRASDVSWRQFEAERARQRLGLADSFRVLQAETLALQTEQQLNAAQAAWSNAVTGYKFALGSIADAYVKALEAR